MGNNVLVGREPNGAIFTGHRGHRVYLWRKWEKAGSMIMFIGLNPSTADESRDDPTIRRCIGFAQRWGYSGMFMCNAYTLVSPDPKKLNTEKPVTMGAYLAMRTIRGLCKEAVAAWGNQIELVRGWEEWVRRIRDDLAPLQCFGTTKLGHPRHPLYLPYSAQLELLAI